MIDSVLKIVQGIVRIRGGTDNTVIGNTSDKLKVEASAGTDLNTSALALESTQLAQSTLYGAVNETAPGTDTASSGLNGRLQRIAQRITSLIAVFNPLTTQPTSNASGIVTRSIPYKAPTFRAFLPGVAVNTGKSMVSLLNASGSTVKVRVTGVRIVSTQTTNISGAILDFQLRRITNHTGGTEITTTPSATGAIDPMDSADALNASVTARTNATLTGESGFALWRVYQSSDELSVKAGGSIETEDHSTMGPNYYFRPTDSEKPITLNAGEGITIRQNTTSTAGQFDMEVIFTQEAS